MHFSEAFKTSVHDLHNSAERPMSYFLTEFIKINFDSLAEYRNYFWRGILSIFKFMLNFSSLFLSNFCLRPSLSQKFYDLEFYFLVETCFFVCGSRVLTGSWFLDILARVLGPGCL